MEERFSGPIAFNAIDFYRNGRRGELSLVSRRIIFTSANRTNLVEIVATERSDETPIFVGFSAA
jgi:hypothetical protein